MKKPCSLTWKSITKDFTLPLISIVLIFLTLDLQFDHCYISVTIRYIDCIFSLTQQSPKWEKYFLVHQKYKGPSGAQLLAGSLSGFLSFDFVFRSSRVTHAPLQPFLIFLGGKYWIQKYCLKKSSWPYLRNSVKGEMARAQWGWGVQEELQIIVVWW